jgi:hypothetical protein
VTLARRYREPPTPPVTVTIPGPLRGRVAAGLLEEIRLAEGSVNARGKPIPRMRQLADDLREIYDRVVP